MWKKLLWKKLLRKKTRGTGGTKVYPRVSRVDTLVPTGCLFNVGNRVERYRVEKLGGEEEFTRQILDEVRPGESFFDIGANIGLVSIHAAVLGCRVIAFEPDPGIRARLLGNIALNALTNVQVMDWAVSDTAGVATLWTDGTAGSSPSLQKTGERNSIEVRTDSIDRAIVRGDFAVPDVVKIDVEGAETHVLRGMASLLASPARPRTLFLELHPTFLPGFGSSADEAEGLVLRAGYERVFTAVRADQIHSIYRVQDSRS